MSHPSVRIQSIGPLVTLLAAFASPLAAQTAATPDRLALGGPPPVVRTQAQLVRFIDESSRRG